MFIDEVISILVAGGIGTFPGTIIGSTLGKIPTGPGPYTSVVESGGSGPEGTHNSTKTPAYERPNAQIVVRASDYKVAATRAQLAYNTLYPIRNQFVQGTWWRQVTMLQSKPGDIGVDDAGRAQLSFNISVTKRPSAA